MSWYDTCSECKEPRRDCECGEEPTIIGDIKEYKENSSGKVVVVESNNAAGMCKLTLGMTLILYRYKENPSDFPFVMEWREFDKHFS